MTKRRGVWQGLARRRVHAVSRGAFHNALRLVPDDGDMMRFVAAVAEDQGRPITVLDCDLPSDAPSGLWLQLAEADYIVCARSVSAEHRRVVICHEIAHMLLGHQPRDGAIDTSSIAPSIDLDVAARFFTRHGYEDDVEADAETLATVLAAELSRRKSAALAVLSRTQDNVSARLR